MNPDRERAIERICQEKPFGIAGWRWSFVAGSLGAVIVWFVRTRLPESPRWLESGPMFSVVAVALWIVILDIALFAPSTTGRSLEEVNVA